MNKKSIDKLRKHFILIALLSFTCVMFFIGGLVYVINIAAARHEAYETLTIILDNDGELNIDADKVPQSLLDKYFFLSKQSQSSPEFSYQTRYFYVEFDQEMKPS